VHCKLILFIHLVLLAEGSSLTGSEAYSQPSPPLTLTHHSNTYILHSNVSVRQSVETIADGSDHDPNDAQDRRGIHTVSESILDLENNQKSTACKVRLSIPSFVCSVDNIFLG
jgi:hypothetical protein